MSNVCFNASFDRLNDGCKALEVRQRCPFQGLGDEWKTAKEFCKYYNMEPIIKWYTGCKIINYAGYENGCHIKVTAFFQLVPFTFNIDSNMMLEYVPIYPIWLSIKRLDDNGCMGVCLYEKSREDKPFLIGTLIRK